MLNPLLFSVMPYPVEVRRPRSFLIKLALRLLLPIAHQIRKIVERMDMPSPKSRQTMLFSAIFPSAIQRLASDFLSNYVFLWLWEELVQVLILLHRRLTMFRKWIKEAT